MDLSAVADSETMQVTYIELRSAIEPIDSIATMHVVVIAEGGYRSFNTRIQLSPEDYEYCQRIDCA